MAMPSRSSGPASSRRPGVRPAALGSSPWPSLRAGRTGCAPAARHRDDGVGEDEEQDEPPDRIATDCQRHAALHEAPDDERRGQGAGAERHVQQVHRPAAAFAVDVEDEAVRAAVQATGPEGGDHRRGDEGAPRWGQAEAGDPDSVDEDAATQDERGGPARSVNGPPPNDPVAYATLYAR